MALLTWLRRFLVQQRRVVAVALLALAVLALAQFLKPSSEDGVQVAVTRRTVAAGSVLTSQDVWLVELPRAALPANTISRLEDLLGRTVGFKLSPNTVLQPAMFSQADLPPGRALVPITLPNPQLLSLIVPGTSLTLVSAEEAGGSLITADAVVTAVPASEPAGSLRAIGNTSGLLLIEVPSQVAVQVAILGQRNQLNLILGRV